MRVVHIVGRQNNGKTRLVCELVEELTRRGLSVGTIKHSSHDHELDRPGKDSYLHRRAGASPAAVVAANELAIYLSTGADDDPIARLEPMFAACDLVLVEGFIDREGVKVEVWRREIGKPLLADRREGIVAVVSDDAPQVAQPVWPRSDVPRVADEILKLAGVE